MPCYCGATLPPDASFCTACGRRVRRKKSSWALLAGIVVVAMAIAVAVDRGMAPQTPQAAAHDENWNAVYACQEWTRTHSPLAVGEVLDRYNLTTQQPLPANTYRVGLRYRAGASGLLMSARCDLVHTGGQFRVLSFSVQPVK